MSILPRTIVALLIAGLTATVSADESPKKSVDQLIAQLGAPKYVLRQQAANELEQWGLVAFEPLMQATEHADPEIAAASRHLIETMPIEWPRDGDPPRVRQVMQSYGKLPENGRLQQLRGLAAAVDEGGAAALCRIARFDPSEEVSRAAAMQLIGADGRRHTMRYRPAPVQVEAIAQAVNELAEQYGPSRRTAGKWLRLFAKQTETPTETIDAWREAISDEMRWLNEQRDFADPNVLSMLRWNLLRVLLAAGQETQPPLEAIDEVLSALLAEANNQEYVLTRALGWMVEAEADAVIDATITAHNEQFQTKSGLYLIARIRREQGKEDAAEKLAQRAFDQPPAEGDHRVRGNVKVLEGRATAGMRLLFSGLIDWGERELRAAMEMSPVISTNSAASRWELARVLYDHARYQDAADVLQPIVDKMNESAADEARFGQLRSMWEALPTAGLVRSQHSYFAGLAARAAGDRAAEVEHLREAIGLEPDNADILIALYRACQGDDSAVDDDFRAEVRDRIESLAEDFQEDIDREPNQAVGYNQWAWLISNTEGDFDKAVRYSQRSLEINPGEAGYLDTLARCYYAAGDYDQAVKTQRRAVELEPHMMVMQRQLAEFEKALVEQRGDAND